MERRIEELEKKKKELLDAARRGLLSTSAVFAEIHKIDLEIARLKGALR